MLGYGPYGMMGYGSGWGAPGWMMLFGGIFWIVLLVLAVMFVVWLVRGPYHARHYPPHIEPSSSGLSILEERYARGEIGRDEYLQKKRDILGRGGSG